MGEDFRCHRYIYIYAFPPQNVCTAEEFLRQNYFQYMKKFKNCDAGILDFPKICVALLQGGR